MLPFGTPQCNDDEQQTGEMARESDNEPIGQHEGKAGQARRRAAIYSVDMREAGQRLIAPFGDDHF